MLAGTITAVNMFWDDLGSASRVIASFGTGLSALVDGPSLAVVGDQGDDFERSGELPPIPRTSRASRKSSLTPRGGRESRVSRLRDAAGAVVDAVGDLRRPSPTPRQPQPEARRGTAIVTRGQEGLISDAI